MQNICIIEQNGAPHTKSKAPIHKTSENVRVFDGLANKHMFLRGPMQNVCIFTSKMTACVSPK